MFLIGNAIHTMTSQKAPTQIINKLGNCCSYERVLKVENAQEELFQELSQQRNLVSLKSYQPGKHVLIYFWSVSFDCKK